MQNAIKDNFWSGANIIDSYSFQKSYYVVQDCYKNKYWKINMSNLTNIFSTKFRALITSSLYHFLTVVINFVNFLLIAFGDSFLNENDQTDFLNICFILFLIDFFLKIFANNGISSNFRDFYNGIDLLCLVSYGIYRVMESQNYIDNTYTSSRFLLAIQPIRAFRLLKYLSFMSTIQHVAIKTLSDYLPLAIILFVILFTYTLFGLQLFFKYSVDQTIPFTFQDFYTGFSSCFTILTLDNWYSFMQYYMPKMNRVSVVAFTLTLFLFGNFVLLDLFIAAMLNGFETYCLNETESEERSNENFLISDLVTQSNFNHLASLRSSLQVPDENNSADKISNALKKKLGKYLILLSGYWNLKNHEMSKYLRYFIKSAFFRTIIYLLICFSCIQMCIESFYEGMRNYKDEMDYNIFVINIVINVLFLVEILLKVYTQGLVEGFMKNKDFLFFVLEICNSIGFFSFYFFPQKNLLLQVCFFFFL